MQWISITILHSNSFTSVSRVFRKQERNTENLPAKFIVLSLIHTLVFQWYVLILDTVYSQADN